MRHFWSLLIILCSVSAVSAADSGLLAQSYTKATLQVLTDLKTAGITQIGCAGIAKNCFTPDELIGFIERQEVQFKEVENFEKPDGATRWSAFYEPATGVVHLNTSVHHEESTQGEVGLHEVLGASGRAETQYEISRAVAVLRMKNQNGQTLPLSQDALNSLKSYIARGQLDQTLKDPTSDANSMLKTESGTVFGGGGDGAALAQRILFYNYMIKSDRLVNPEYRARFLGLPVNIEITDSDDDHLTFKLKNSADYLPSQIFIPRKLTVQKPKRDLTAPNRGLEQLAILFEALGVPFFPQVRPLIKQIFPEGKFTEQSLAK